MKTINITVEKIAEDIFIGKGDTEQEGAQVLHTVSATSIPKALRQLANKYDKTTKAEKKRPAASRSEPQKGA